MPIPQSRRKALKQNAQHHTPALPELAGNIFSPLI
jgi:hypothetical protein